jgi:hypothetical protein
MERAVPDDIVNFFIRKYSFTRDKALNASKFYLHLLEKSEKPVSSELSAFLTEKVATAGQSTTNSASAFQRERLPARSQIKDSRPRQSSVGRQIQHGKSRSLDIDERAPIQAVISIKLEKDTPPEYWDRVLALLGERRLAANSEETVSEEAANLPIDPEVSADSAFT